MKTIQRYVDPNGNHLDESEYGPYVLWADHVRELAALREAILEARDHCYLQRTSLAWDVLNRAALNQGK